MMVDDKVGRSLGELRLSLRHLRSAAALFAGGLWESAHAALGGRWPERLALWPATGKLVAEARRRVEESIAPLMRLAWRDPFVRQGERVATRPPLAGLTVLLVDDVADDRDAMQTMFESLGARVIVAEHGREALDKLANGGTDVILCDLRMPVMDGWEFIQRLRADPGRGEVPAIAVSGFGGKGSSRRARELGYDAYFTKPLDYDALESCVRSAVEKRRETSH